MNVMKFLVPKSLVEYATSDSTVRQALEKMRFHRYVAIPVIDEEGRYIGTLRNDDVLNYILSVSNSAEGYQKRAERDSVLGLLNKSYISPVYHSASMNELAERVKEHNFVPVVDDRGCFIGIVLRRDILNYLLDYYNDKNRGKQNGEK